MTTKCVGNMNNCLRKQSYTDSAGKQSQVVISTKLDNTFGRIRSMFQSGLPVNNFPSIKAEIQTPNFQRAMVRALDKSYEVARNTNLLSELESAANVSGANFAFLNTSNDPNTPISLQRLAQQGSNSEYSDAVSSLMPNIQLSQLDGLLDAVRTDPAAVTNQEAVAQENTPLVPTQDTTIKSFQYPSDALYQARGEQDYMKIERFQYRPPQEKIDSPATILSTGLSRGSNLKKFEGVVKLPIPNDLQASQGVQWGQAQANILEAGMFLNAQSSISDALKGTKNFMEIMNDMLSDSKNILNALKNQGGQASGVNQAISGAIAKMLLSKVGINVDPAQFIARKEGQVLNPNLELLFQGPKLRNFVFRYDFAPNSQEDTRQVNAIQRFFKEGMLPFSSTNEITAAGNAGAGDKIYLGSPDIFRIGYFNGTRRIKSLPVHKICALTQVGVNFTDQGVYQSYYDENVFSQPVRSTMILNFTELTPLFREDYTRLGSSVMDLSVDGDGFAPLLEPNGITEEDIGF